MPELEKPEETVADPSTESWLTVCQPASNHRLRGPTSPGGSPTALYDTRNGPFDSNGIL